MNISTLTALLIACALGLLGCASPGVLQMSADTYVVSKSSAAGAFTNMAKLRAAAIQEANAFAAKQGKVAVAIASREVVPTHGFPSFEYQFRLLDRDDPRAQGVSLEPRPDLVIEKNEKVTKEIKIENASEAKSDLYADITKLDDLRKRGLLTDAEFDAEKKKLLEKSK